MAWTLRRILFLIGLISVTAVFGTLVWLNKTYQHFSIGALNERDRMTVSYLISQRIDTIYNDTVFPFIDNWSRFSSLVSAMEQESTEKATIATDQILLTLEVVNAKVKLRNVVVYTKDMTTFATTTKGFNESISSKPAIIHTLNNRDLAQQRHAMSFLWRSESGRPLYSVIAPIGGFRALGFIEFVIDPIPDLSGIGDVFGGLFRIKDSEGNVLLQDPAPPGLIQMKSDGRSNTTFQIETLAVEIRSFDDEVWAIASIDRDVQSFMSRINDFRNDAMLSIGLVVVGSFLFGWLLLRLAVFNRLKEFAGSMKALSQGQTTVPIPETGPDEFATMRAALIDLKDAVNMRVELQKKAESATMAKTKFLAAASHDLRQPLQAITLFMYALRQRENDAQNQEIIQQINNSVESLKELLDALLDISKLDAGVISADKQTVSMPSILDSLADEFQPLAQSKGLELHVVQSSLFVFSDPVLLKNILRNLLSNAIRYTEEGKILIGCRKSGDQLRIEIWDSGKGIAEDQQKLIFDEFYQVDNSARNRRFGLGLGLSIVRRMTTLLNHELSVRSTLGKGSVFSITLDLSKEVPSQDIQPLSLGKAKSNNKKPTLLVVEDDPIICGATIMLLRSWGYETLHASSSDAAIKAVMDNGSHPDLLILDYQLPGQLNGLQTHAAITKIFAHDIPGIIVSGDTKPEHLDLFDESGLLYMAKPIDPKELHQHLITLLS